MTSVPVPEQRHPRGRLSPRCSRRPTARARRRSRGWCVRLRRLYRRHRAGRRRGARRGTAQVRRPGRHPTVAARLLQNRYRQRPAAGLAALVPPDAVPARGQGGGRFRGRRERGADARSRARSALRDPERTRRRSATRAPTARTSAYAARCALVSSVISPRPNGRSGSSRSCGLCASGGVAVDGIVAGDRTAPRRRRIVGRVISRSSFWVRSTTCPAVLARMRHLRLHEPRGRRRNAGCADRGRAGVASRRDDGRTRCRRCRRGRHDRLRRRRRRHGRRSSTRRAASPTTEICGVRMGSAARQRCEDRFSLEKSVEQWRVLLDDLIVGVCTSST